jgi:hypothetical protein
MSFHALAPATPPASFEVVERCVARLRAQDASALTYLGAELTIEAHETSAEAPSIVIREPQGPPVRLSTARTVGIVLDVMCEAPSTPRDLYSPRRFLAAMHEFAHLHLVGFDPEEDGPLDFARVAFPVGFRSAANAPAHDAERDVLYSLSTLTVALAPPA